MKKQKLKQILAIIGIILLVSMYACTFIFSLMKSEAAHSLFLASIACTIIVPVFLYAFLLVAKTLKPQKSPVIDNIVFDVGKVLLDFPWETYSDQLNFPEDTKKFLRKNVVYSKLWGEFDYNIRPYEDIVNEFCAINPEYAKEIRELVDTIDRCVSPYPYTDQWLYTLKSRGYHLCLLSNWSKPIYERLKKEGVMDFEKYMDKKVWSFEHHIVKPNKAIFDLLGVDPARTVFIDDMEANVKAAESYGYHVILFRGYPDAQEKLKALGVR